MLFEGLSRPLFCILMLLGSVSESQCSAKTYFSPPARRLQGLSLRVQAGTAFNFSLSLPAIQDHLQHIQVSLDNDNTIPRWLAFTEKIGVLSGLALKEDYGQYYLKVTSVTGTLRSVTYFNLHVLSDTLEDGNIISTHFKKCLLCPTRETLIIWADLLLQVDPGHLDAYQRVQLVNIMADYLRLAPGSVQLFSLRSSTALQREKIRVCRQGVQTDDDTLERGQSAELLWQVGCGVGDQMSDLARILEHSTTSGRLATVLGVPTLGWRVLCKGAFPRNRRALQPLRHTATPTAVLPPPTPVPESSLDLFPEPSIDVVMAYPTAIVDDSHTTGLNTEFKQALSNFLTYSAVCEGCLQILPSGTTDNLLSMHLKSFLYPPEYFTQSQITQFHPAINAGKMSTVNTPGESTVPKLISKSSSRYFLTLPTHTLPISEHFSMDQRTNNMFSSASYKPVYVSAIGISPTVYSKCDSNGRTITSQSIGAINLVYRSNSSQIFLPLTVIQTAPHRTKDPSRFSSVLESSQLTFYTPGDTQAQLSQSAQNTKVEMTSTGELAGTVSAITFINLEHTERPHPIYADSQAAHPSSIVPPSPLSLHSALVLKPSQILSFMKSMSTSHSVDSTNFPESAWGDAALLETFTLHSIYPSLESKTPKLESWISTVLLDNIPVPGSSKPPDPLSKVHNSMTASRLAVDSGPVLIPNSALEDGQSEHLIDTFGHVLTNNLLFLLGSNLENPFTKSPPIIPEMKETISSMTEQQRQTAMLSSFKKTTSAMYHSHLEASTTTAIPLEKTIPQPFLWRLTATSSPFNEERPETNVLSSKNERLESMQQQVDLHSLASTLSQVTGRQLAFDETLVTTHISFPLSLYGDQHLVPLAQSAQHVMVSAENHISKTHRLQTTAGTEVYRAGSLTVDLSQKSLHSSVQSIASLLKVYPQSSTFSKESWQVETQRTLEPSLIHRPLAAPATSELYFQITSVPTTEFHVDSVQFTMKPGSVYDSSYSIPQATVELPGTIGHNQLHPIAPSAVLDWYTKSSLLLLSDLEPSYPHDTLSIVSDVGGGGCTSLLHCLSLEDMQGVSSQMYPSSFLDFILQSGETHNAHVQSRFSLELREHHSRDVFYTLMDTSRRFSSNSPKDDLQTAALTHTQSEYISLKSPSMTTLFSFPGSAPSPPSILVIPQTSPSIPTSVLEASNMSAVSLLMNQSLPRSRGVMGSSRPNSVFIDTENCPSTSPRFLRTGWSECERTSIVSSALFKTQEASSGFVFGAPSPPISHSAAITGLSNLPPKVLKTIPPLMATIGFPFHYIIPSGTFLDPEDGATEYLVLELSFFDGPPVTLGPWVALDGLELHGVPLDVDLQFAPQQLLLTARDGQGLAAWLPLILDLQRSHAEPCHSFGLTAHRSLHSILRQRHRVELLLDKLARFFNDSGSHNLAVLSLAPGSTIVSWYNFTLCRVEVDGVQGHCPLAQVKRMWGEITLKNGQISPAFSEAMLPEFPINNVGPVRYKIDCFYNPTTAAPTASPSLSVTTKNLTSDKTIPNTHPSAATTVSLQQTNLYCWMTSALKALLVVCCLFLALIIPVALYFVCRSRVRARTLAIWPSDGIVPGHANDLRAIRPRIPPLFRPEVPPTAPSLWLNIAPSHREDLNSIYLQNKHQKAAPSQPRTRYTFSPQGKHNRTQEFNTPEEKPSWK